MVLIGATALVGWQVGSLRLVAVLPGAVALWPMTAVALIVGALGLTLAAAGHRWAPALAGALLLAACGVWVWGDVTGRALPLDLAMFREQVLAQNSTARWPGRPSMVTAAVISLVAASLIGAAARAPRARLAAVVSASLGGLLASLSVLAYLLQDPSQLAILDQSLLIALNTTVAAGALCVGVLILMRDTGWVRLVASRGERGRIARLLAPVALIPIAIGAAANLGVRLGLYGPDVRMLLVIVLSALALVFLAFWAAGTLAQERSERDSLARALERSTVIVCTAQGVIQHWPQACAALYGWTAKEAVGRHAGELIGMGSPERRAAILALVQRQGEWRGEQQHRRRDGKVLWIAGHWVRQDGGPDGESRLIGTLNDITELKLAEASLRESRERLALAVDAYDLGIGDFDVATDRVTLEPGLERIFGVGPGELNGDPAKFAALVEETADVGALNAARVPQLVDDRRFRRADGETRELHGVRRFFYGPDGAHTRTVGVYRDVTEERRAQRELAQRGDRMAELRSELAHVSRLSAMGEMAAALAHELNQPLTAIGNSVGALKLMLGDATRVLDDTARARVVRAADQAEGQAVRAGEIVRRLRDFIARGEADARIEPMNPLIEDALALTLPDVKAAQIAVQLDLSKQAARVLADRIQIQQVMVNLIRNATEAMRGAPGAHVLAIATTVRKGMAEIAVRDSGPGVSPELAQRLFSPFQSTKNDGMGVGLSICRRIVEAHGGRMWLEPPQGAGADFRFTLPLASKEFADAQ